MLDRFALNKFSLEPCENAHYTVALSVKSDKMHCFILNYEFFNTDFLIVEVL